jgi:hypothetical protein
MEAAPCGQRSTLSPEVEAHAKPLLDSAPSLLEALLVANGALQALDHQGG